MDQRIQDEDLRTRKFLHPVSCSRVVRECQSRLVEQYIPYLQTECRQMVKEEKREGVTKMERHCVNHYFDNIFQNPTFTLGLSDIVSENTKVP